MRSQQGLTLRLEPQAFQQIIHLRLIRDHIGLPYRFQLWPVMASSTTAANGSKASSSDAPIAHSGSLQAAWPRERGMSPSLRACCRRRSLAGSVFRGRCRRTWDITLHSRRIRTELFNIRLPRHRCNYRQMKARFRQSIVGKMQRRLVQ